MKQFPWLALTVVCGAVVASFASDTTPQSERRAGDAKLVVKPDAFKTLVNPMCSHCVDEAKRRAGELKDDDRVLAWIRGYSQGGGIPLRFFLVPYRVISDTYGVFVFDPDAGYMHGFEPSLDFEFHGWRGGVMVMKHKDGTLYSCLSGRAFDGPRKGHELKPVPTVETDWGWWLQAYPGAVAYHMFEKYQPIELPNRENADSIATRGKPDPRLPATARVIGVAVGEHAKAYPISALEKPGLIADAVGDQKLVVLWYGPTRTAAVFAPELDEEKDRPKQAVSLRVDTAEPGAPFVDTATGSRFDIVGRAVEGPLKGRTLRWLPGVQCRWFAWAAEYPETELYTATAKALAAPTPSPSLPLATSRKTGQQAAAKSERLEAVLVEPDAVTRDNVSQWREAGFKAVAAVLDDRHDREVYEAAARAAAAGPLDLFYWIEVARNPAMAEAHPDWMASLGMHQDWHERFPNTPLPKKGEVAKAYPWVPIGYREALDAHLDRVEELLDRAAGPYRGLLLNDLQGGPASCGCGNLQCRWAIDYHVPATANKLDGDDVAARFVAEVQRRVGTKTVIPVWTTECEDEDLPEGKRAGAKSTGYCGGVPCAVGTCPKAFTQQWSALVAGHRGPIGVLATHKEFARDRSEYGDTAGWIARAVDYLDSVPAKNAGASVPHHRLWLVIQGYDLSPAEQSAARRAAGRTGAGAVLVALTRLDQSYEPRIVSAQ